MLLGRLSIESHLKKGTKITLTVSLKLDERYHERAALMIASEKRRAHPRVLIVEDNVTNSQALHVLLKELGCLSDIAEEGETALRYLGSTKREYDLIMVDINLPDMDGIELAKQIRTIPTLRATPIIAVSAHVTEELIAQCADADIDNIFTKPIYMNTLESILENHLPGYRDR